MYIYQNGEFVLETEARISPFDHGFLYGLGVFETFRIYDGHPFLLDDHFQRLAVSVKELNIVFDIKKEEFLEIITSLLKLNKLNNAYIRFNISAGEAPIGLQTEAYTKPNVFIFMKPLVTSLARTKKATFLQTFRNTPEGSQRLKSHHYLNSILGKREVPDTNTEGIFLTKDGWVAEGVVSNIFWVKSGQVYTPTINTGILKGITRQFIIELLKRNEVAFNEGYYLPQDVLEADEVFITNSIQEIVSISKLDEHEYSYEGKVTHFLQSLYDEYKSQRLWSMKQL